MHHVDREAAARAIDAFLRALGRDPGREPEIATTGARVAAAWADELLAGYAVDVDALVSGAVLAGSTRLVVVRDIPVVTVCPHHLTLSSGAATVAFAPKDRLIGVGAVAALVDAFARRLALQEQIGENVAAALARHLEPRWAACRLVLSHGCMTARGERAHGARVETVAQSGGDAAEVFAALGVGAGAGVGAGGAAGGSP
jgi:GTP cyclohydrolase I